MKYFISFLSLFLILETSSSQSTFTVTKSGKGKSVLFINAIGCPATVWSDVIAKLDSTKICCYIITPAGFGTTVMGNLENDYEKMITELKNYIVDTKLTNAALVGHSFGGFLSLQLAAYNPTLFSKIVVLDAYPYYLENLVPGITESKAAVLAKQTTQSLLQMPDKVFESTQRQAIYSQIKDSIKREMVLNWVLKTNRSVFAKAMEYMLSKNLQNMIGNIKSPVSIIATCPDALEATKEKIEKQFFDQYKNLKNKSIQIWNCHHFMFFERPGDVAFLIANN